jgi:hypothetical protein
MVRPQVADGEDGLQVTMEEQSRIVDKRWSFSLRVGRVAKSLSSKLPAVESLLIS